MYIEKEKIASCKNQDIYLYSIDNKKGLSAQILNYGGIIKKLVYNGVDVVLGRDSFEEYLNNDGYFGAIIGRNSNRIKNSEFEIGKKLYKLFANDGENNLHGGKDGFDKKIWDVKMIDEEEPSLVLSTISPDGEESFPGNVKVQVAYTLTKDNSLKIQYIGESDEDTVLNMTNHTYFNLNGHSSGSIENHLLWLNSGYYTPNADDCIPTGEILSVKNTPFDFTKEHSIIDGLKADNEQIEKIGGFDHNFVLNGCGYRKIGKCTGDKSGIAMEIYTDQPGMQIYSGNVIEENRICKNGMVYGKHHGICFETQGFPNSMNFSHFPSVILKRGERYETVTSYKFI